MFPGPELDKDADEGNENQELNGFSDNLASLHSIGETLFRIVPTSVDPETFVEVERLLNNLLVELDGTLRNSKHISLENGSFMENLFERIMNQIMPPVSVWSLYAQGQLEYGPNDLKDLYAMVKPIGTMLRNLPKRFP